MTLQPGALLRHYEIRGLLGKGGMGEVWRAHDTRLKRDVALKLLPAAMSASSDRVARLRQEAETVARLNHPNIVTLYSVEEDDGLQFLTMELVGGRSLDSLITRGGLPIDDVLRIGIGLADALAAAHEKRVVHRDLKPANIVVGESCVVKVLDFGLAKLTSPEEPLDAQAATEVRTPVTREGTVLGTVAYMSPEQARGKIVDHRTDLFSLGIVLYELVTGTRPFRGETSADVTSALLRETPPPVSDARPGVPRDLARIIARCLEKDPERRISSALDVRNELQAVAEELKRPFSISGVSRRTGRGPIFWIAAAAVAVIATVALLMKLDVVTSSSPAVVARAIPAAPAPAVVVDPRSIAVLPFADLSPGKDQEYFSDGIAEELLNLLTRIPDLRVTSRSSSFAFKAKTVETREIGRALQVAHLLGGSVRKAGNRVRITARLIDPATDTQVWSQTWDRELSDIFAIQDEIAADVTSQLRVTILGDAPRARKTDPAAYAIFLQARQRETRKPEDLEAAVVMLRRVLEIDPRYAPAWSALANNYLDQGNVGVLPPNHARHLARDAALRALDADPLFAAAHGRLAASVMGNDLAVAARHLERGLAVEPANVALRLHAAGLLRFLGRTGEAAPIYEQLVRQDPLNATAFHNYALTLRDAGRLKEAASALRRAQELSPRRGVTRGALAKVLLLDGDPAGALAQLQAEPMETFRMIGMPMAQYALGRRAESDQSLAALKAKYAKETAFNIAEIHAFRGETDEAFAWLGKAVESSDAGLQAIVTNPFLKPLHTDRRWLPLVARIGRDPETLAKVKFRASPS